MGSFFPPDGDFSTPQLVRYEKGEKFDVHHDWYDEPQPVRGKGQRGRWFNRMASFFVYLEGGEGGSKGGETWFPYVEVKAFGEGKWAGDKVEGGTRFVPRGGNALFWINLHANGTGDGRTVHAGLPLVEGRKTAMNIWPRKFYGRGAR
jgi:prolyl 4-hydroxylase